MTIATALSDFSAIDPRAKSAKGTTGDPASASDQSFDGILSTLASETSALVGPSAGNKAISTKALAAAIPRFADSKLEGPAGGRSMATAADLASGSIAKARTTAHLPTTSSILQTAPDQPNNTLSIFANSSVEKVVTEQPPQSSVGRDKTTSKKADPSQDAATAADLSSVAGVTPSLEVLNLLTGANQGAASIVASHTIAEAEKPTVLTKNPTSIGVAQTKAVPPPTISDVAVTTELAPTMTDSAKADWSEPGGAAPVRASDLQPSEERPKAAQDGRIGGTAAGPDNTRITPTARAPGAADIADGTRPDAARASDSVVSTKAPKTPPPQEASSSWLDPTSVGPGVAVQTPLQAVVGAVSALAASDPVSGTAASVPASNERAASAPARTMTLQLAPADLGTVSVRMHLTAGSLDLRLSVSDQQTLGLLSRERDALTNALNDQAYQLHSLVIQGTDAPVPAQGGNHATQNDQGGNTGAGQERGSGASDHGGTKGQADSRQNDRGGSGDRASRPRSESRTEQLFV